jgi:hypothetical protein
MATFKNDYKTGKSQEMNIIETIRQYFNDNINSTTDKFSPYDYVGDHYVYELKSRNNVYKAYPTTLIGGDKIIEGKPQIFLFKFLDGLYYIEKDEKLFKTFVKEDFVRHQRTDFIDIKKKYIFIPIDKLKKIEKVI